VVGADLPAVRGVVERGRGDAGGQLDVASEIEAIGDVVEIALDLGLFRVAARPLPLLRQLRREGIAVVVALGIAPRAGVAVPVPRAADAVTTSKARTLRLRSSRNLWTAYRPAKPAPTTTTSKSG